MRDRNKRKLIMYGLMVALMVTTVAYAVLQTTLNINGTVTKKGGSWDIHFANLSTPTLTGDAKSTNANIQATSFTFSATVVKPKDAIVYTFDVVNGGSIDATLDSVTLTGATEAKTQDITYTLTYADGKSIAKGDKLVSGQTRSLKLTVSYDDVDTISSTSDITLNLGATLIYVQADKEEGDLGGETERVLKSVTLTDLYNADKVRVSDLTKMTDMVINPIEVGLDYNYVTITLDSYAKISLEGLGGDPNFDYIIINYADGSVHRIDYDEVDVPVVTAEGLEPEIQSWSGIIYYIDNVPQYVIESSPFTIEGNIQSIELSTYFVPIKFHEILIEE